MKETGAGREARVAGGGWTRGRWPLGCAHGAAVVAVVLKDVPGRGVRGWGTGPLGGWRLERRRERSRSSNLSMRESSSRSGSQPAACAAPGSAGAGLDSTTSASANPDSASDPAASSDSLESASREAEGGETEPGVSGSSPPPSPPSSTSVRGGSTGLVRPEGVRRE
eukprot:scaffold234343_cov29-Tisochrysis_lutea.AAC.3